MIEIVPVLSVADIDQARALFQEYADMLGVDLCFQGFAQELATLPGKYGPPHGCLLLAKEGEKAVGCVALRPMEQSGYCEMKRLFVQPACRGTGLGRRLAVRILEEARQRGYARMRLDTLDKLQAAIQLYRELGFVEIPAYYRNPEPNVVYMELDLRNK
jgi:ribosomal protein S18 acetylase RimI-like enzyme